MSLATEVLEGNRRALSRLISAVENHSPDGAAALAELYPHTGRAHLVGITGSPGTGKSSLVNQITLALRSRGKTVGIVAVDPTSPFSGGAILGDRIRMRDLSGDPGVFIRSMATRGSLGGLARATADVVKVLDGAGFDTILIETVGAGQSEVDIASHAHTVLVVEAPGMGDDVQAIKAGILEIADILVVNKSDDPRAQNTIRTLRAMLDLNASGQGQKKVSHHGQLVDVVMPPDASPEQDDLRWDVPIQATDALSGEGIDDVIEALDRHRTHLQDNGGLKRRLRKQVITEIDALLSEALLARLLERVDRSHLDALVERVVSRELVPQAVVEMLIDGS
ncbi:MAG: methylmalonyl Co-A mutase-associated GTPase MeaB [Anaerolineae bacterium]|nr:methylmalonyl Co-A mutase-associated GTPase MeaB [Anaerolineae bacterium]